MKAISLWQPWASLWLSGVKIHETRSWHIRKQWKAWEPGDRIAIHAAKEFIKDHDAVVEDILRRRCGERWFETLPVGALIGTIIVADCVPTESVITTMADDVCGDFREGRYAWRGADPIIFPQPIPWRGSQGIFNVPDDPS
jgi:hypothetical protein